MMEEKFKAKAILEETVTLIRPSANAQHKDEIMKSIGDAGYTILRSIEKTINENQFDKLYSRHAEAEYYGNLKEEMLSGPSTILELQKEDALTDWRALIGPMLDAKENAPDSLRAKFQVGDVNPIHAASNQSQVKLEADLFFENQDDVQKQSAVSIYEFVVFAPYLYLFSQRQKSHKQLQKCKLKKLQSKLKQPKYQKQLLKHRQPNQQLNQKLLNNLPIALFTSKLPIFLNINLFYLFILSFIYSVILDAPTGHRISSTDFDVVKQSPISNNEYSA